VRDTFLKTLCEIAERDERIWLLNADLGYSVLEPFIQKFPDRYVNVGIAEQNMIGIAAGLAHSGNVVFCYSIVNFATFRCLEQIRDDACYHELPVKVVSVGGGFSYGPQGYTHHGLEDIAVTRVLPNMTVMAPSDPWEAKVATEALAASSGPGYLRLGRSKEPLLNAPDAVWRNGEPMQLRKGSDVLVIACGAVAAEAVAAAETLGGRAEVWTLPQIKPLPRTAIEEAARRFKAIVTVEESQIDGGMGSAVAEVVAELGTGCRVIRRGVDGTILEHALSQASARKRYGIDAESLGKLLLSLT
jgi:transketolase